MDSATSPDVVRPSSRENRPWITAETLLTTVAAAVFVAGTTFLHGWMTNRWTEYEVPAELKRSAELLESRFPRSFGDWEAESDVDFDPREIERAGAVGHVSRVYRNRKNRARVTVFVVCATPHDASGHTPDRCYPGAGFEIAEAEQRQTLKLADGRSAAAFNGTFRKSGQTLRVFWTYGVEGDWLAPKVARYELADARVVYKLYAIIEETSLPAGVGAKICNEFLSTLLPDFDAAIVRPPDTRPATS